MKGLYAYFILHCQTYYRKSGRIGPLESALYCASFVFAQLLISIAVVASKIFDTSSDKFILIAIIVAFGFHAMQRKKISSAFLTKFALKFDVENKSNTQLVLTMISPSLILAIGFLTLLILIK